MQDRVPAVSFALCSKAETLRKSWMDGAAINNRPRLLQPDL
ncbi:MAG: hypothetical protein OXI93_05245 [Bryobacterales bacterium]|nr:hypothetical protein [Bryobacterales bacterium]